MNPNYPYYLVDPRACNYTDDMSYCPLVQKFGECPIRCTAMVKINSLKDAIAFDDYLDEISGEESS